MLRFITFILISWFQFSFSLSLSHVCMYMCMCMYVCVTFRIFNSTWKKIKVLFGEEFKVIAQHMKPDQNFEYVQLENRCVRALDLRVCYRFPFTPVYLKLFFPLFSSFFPFFSLFSLFSSFCVCFYVYIFLVLRDFFFFFFCIFVYLVFWFHGVLDFFFLFIFFFFSLCRWKLHIFPSNLVISSILIFWNVK